MGHKFDERKEDIQTIKTNIENAQNNVAFTNKVIESITDEETIQSLEDQNERRQEAIDSMVKDVNNRIHD